jgi:hypothetical protein
VAEPGQWDHKWGQILTYDIQAGSGAQTRVISALTPIDITKGSRIEFLSKMSSGRYGTDRREFSCLALDTKLARGDSLPGINAQEGLSLQQSGCSALLLGEE